MQEIRNYTVRRSGPGLTIVGEAADGKVTTFTNFVEVRGRDGTTIATDGHGNTFLLSAGAAPPAADTMAFLGEDANEEAERCIACNVAFVDDDLVHTDEGGGFIHASCCGPERESYVKAGGEPLSPEDPIPTPFRWGDLPQPAAAAEA